MQKNNLQIKHVGIRNVKFGADAIIIEHANIYDCEIREKTIVAKYNHMLCELVNIGNDCFIGHGVMFSNWGLVQLSIKK